MPIYEYRCTNCGHQQEFLQKVSDAPPTICTRCGQETFSKMVTAAGFQLKGSGWYATDFKGGAAKPASNDGAGEAKPEGGKGSAGEAKPEGGKGSAGEAKPEGAKSGAGEAKPEGGKDTPPACGSGACPACQ